MDGREQTTPIGDEPREEKTYRMDSVCPNCGGRGGTYDSQGNPLTCWRCNGTGRVDP